MRIRAFLTVVVLAPLLSGAPPEKPYWQQQGCTHSHPSSVSYKRISSIMRQPSLPRSRGARAWHYAKCVQTEAKARAVSRHLRKWRAWRKRNAAELRAQRLWIYYRAHPMPACTWVRESGGDYRAKNPTSTAGGKYQIIDSTWYANGGSRYAVRHPAAAAPPLEQERIARNVLRSQGLGAWVNC